MKYCCNKCGKEVSSDIKKRFIAYDGRCLCSNCSVGVTPCSDEERQLLIDIENGKIHFFNYDINYIYVFSDELEIDNIDILSGDDYRVAGFEEKQSPFLIGAMANDFKYKYSHQFKCKETLFFQTNQKDGNLNMQIEFKEVKIECDYISLIGGLESNFDF